MPVVWGQQLFFFPGKKTLIWKWVPLLKKHDFALVCSGLDNEIFATFHGVQNGQIKFRHQLTEEQEKAILLVLCCILDYSRRFPEIERQIQLLDTKIVKREQRDREEREEDIVLARLERKIKEHEARKRARDPGADSGLIYEPN